ncbi:MAG: ferritin family protein [Dethiobacteria bacterium]
MADEDRSRNWDKKHKNFKDLVKEAIADELSAVAMYAEMANMVKNPVLKAIIFSIAGDEYNHARTWMTILELDP